MVKVFTVLLTTDGSGNATGYTPTCSGLVRCISYVPDGSAPLDTNADIVVTGNVSGVAILTKANIDTSPFTIHPRAAVVAAADSSALVYSAGNPVVDLIPVADEAIKIVVSSGDAAKRGVFAVFIDGEAD